MMITGYFLTFFTYKCTRVLAGVQKSVFKFCHFAFYVRLGTCVMGWCYRLEWLGRKIRVFACAKKLENEKI